MNLSDQNAEVVEKIIDRLEEIQQEIEAHEEGLRQFRIMRYLEIKISDEFTFVLKKVSNVWRICWVTPSDTIELFTHAPSMIRMKYVHLLPTLYKHVYNDNVAYLKELEEVCKTDKQRQMNRVESNHS